MVAHCINCSQYLSASTSQSFTLRWTLPLCLSVSVCVTWQGANLAPYLCLQLCSHSLLHKHLICHHCQSEQIGLPTAESARPHSSPRPRQPASLHVHYQHSCNMHHPARRISHTSSTHMQVHVQLPPEPPALAYFVQVCLKLTHSFGICLAQ